MVMWALNIYILDQRTTKIVRIYPTITMIAILMLVGSISGVLAYYFYNNPRWLMNQSAVEYFPEAGFYEQADKLFEFLYSDRPNAATFLNHAFLLLHLGEQERATQLLKSALDHQSTSQANSLLEAASARNAALIYFLTSRPKQAVEALDKAVSLDQAALQATTNPDKRAEHLWSMARTEVVQRKSSVLNTAHAALTAAKSAAVRRKINLWIPCVKALNTSLTLPRCHVWYEIVAYPYLGRLPAIKSD